MCLHFLFTCSHPVTSQTESTLDGRGSLLSMLSRFIGQFLVVISKCRLSEMSETTLSTAVLDCISQQALAETVNYLHSQVFFVIALIFCLFCKVYVNSTKIASFPEKMSEAKGLRIFSKTMTPSNRFKCLDISSSIGQRLDSACA